MSWFKQSTAFEKICAAAFVFLATISCLATAQSLTLTLGLDFLPFWATLILAFILSVFVYILTSYCFKQMIDSHNDKYCASIHKTVPDRRKMFWGGLLGVLFFWIICSLPTNTHSMLHMKVAKQVALAELDKQKEVLSNKLILTDIDFKKDFRNDSSQLSTSIGILREKFANEVTHQGRPGLGDSAKVILHNIEIKCEVPVGSHFITTGFENVAPNIIVETFDPQINKLCEKRIDVLRGIRDNKIADSYNEKIALGNLISSISDARDGLKNGKINVTQARKVIDDGYSYNSDYEKEMLDKIEVLKKEEDGHNPNNIKSYVTYRIDRLYSVFNVWGDFFSGKLPKEFDMLYWIMWAAILDIAALIFSGIAFRGKVNNTRQVLNY